MAMPSYHDGISPSKATNVVREFGKCPQCGESLDPDVTDALYQDRDVLWENDPEYKSSAHTCRHCNSEVRIFVEEKALGTIGADRLPENAETAENIYFIPVEGSDTYLVVNPFQVKIQEATSRERDFAAGIQ